MEEGGWGKCGWRREGEGVWVDEGLWGGVGGGEEEVCVYTTKLTCILSLKSPCLSNNTIMNNYRIFILYPTKRNY